MTAPSALPSRKARPILMSAPMIRALLDDRKTQTRRVVKPQPTVDGGSDAVDCPEWWLEWKSGEGYTPQELGRLSPYGKPGDLLWVRECFSYGFSVNDDPERRHLAQVWLWADGNPEDGDFAKPRPSIHMPRWASRLTLELTEMRVERKQDISLEDAIAEGLEPVLSSAGEHCGWLNYLHTGEGTGYCTDPRDSYATLTDSINGPGSWDANPWVWCLSFKVHRCNVDELLKGSAA